MPCEGPETEASGPQEAQHELAGFARAPSVSTGVYALRTSRSLTEQAGAAGTQQPNRPQPSSRTPHTHLSVGSFWVLISTSTHFPGSGKNIKKENNENTHIPQGIPNRLLLIHVQGPRSMCLNTLCSNPGYLKQDDQAHAQSAGSSFITALWHQFCREGMALNLKRNHRGAAGCMLFFLF